VLGVGFQFIFGFGLALLLNKKFFGHGIARSISLIPWVTPGVLIGLMWRWIYDGNYGVLNDILLKLGIIHEKIPFLAQQATAFPAVIVTIIWQGIPFFALILLAGLQGIPGELYDAAAVDGASEFQKLFKITISSLKNIIFVTTLLRVIWVANSVDLILNMTEGGPAYSSQTLSIYIFNKGSSLNLGYAATMSIILTLVLSLFTILYLKNIFKHQEG
jgi:multiple sugar transport system permease protein